MANSGVKWWARWFRTSKTEGHRKSELEQQITIFGCVLRNYSTLELLNGYVLIMILYMNKTSKFLRPCFSGHFNMEWKALFARIDFKANYNIHKL